MQNGRAPARKNVIAFPKRERTEQPPDLPPAHGGKVVAFQRATVAAPAAIASPDEATFRPLRRAA